MLMCGGRKRATCQGAWSVEESWEMGFVATSVTAFAVGVTALLLLLLLRQMRKRENSK